MTELHHQPYNSRSVVFVCQEPLQDRRVHHLFHQTIDDMQSCIFVLIWDDMLTVYCGMCCTFIQPVLRFKLWLVSISHHKYCLCTLTYTFYVHILFNFTMNCPGKVIKYIYFKHWCVQMLEGQRWSKPRITHLKHYLILFLFWVPLIVV